MLWLSAHTEVEEFLSPPVLLSLSKNEGLYLQKGVRLRKHHLNLLAPHEPFQDLHGIRLEVRIEEKWSLLCTEI